MALLPKKYLRIYDVAEYLNNLNAGYEYDLSESYDRNKLNDDIYDLVVHGELKAVFKHFTADFIQAYFIVHDKELQAILRFNSWQNMSDAYLIYSYMNGQKPEQDKFVKIINDESIKFDDIYIPKEELDALFNPSNSPIKQIEKLQAENNDLNARLSTARNTYTQHQNEIKALKEKSNQADIEKSELIEQLSKIKAELADKPADSVTHSNTDIQNIKKAAIRQFNRSLAVALIDLDYQSNLRKGDIVNFIIPYMKELAYVLAEEQADKAKVLTVKYKTIYDTHLQGLEFKQGTQTTKERERVNIDLLFKKQLPITE